MELNKFLPILLQPIAVMLALVLPGTFLKNRIRGKLLVLAGCLVLLIFSASPVSNRLMESLQSYFRL